MIHPLKLSLTLNKIRLKMKFPCSISLNLKVLLKLLKIENDSTEIISDIPLKNG